MKPALGHILNFDSSEHDQSVPTGDGEVRWKRVPLGELWGDMIRQ